MARFRGIADPADQDVMGKSPHICFREGNQSLACSTLEWFGRNFDLEEDARKAGKSFWRDAQLRAHAMDGYSDSSFCEVVSLLLKTRMWRCGF